jgi:hypothetical protein
MNRKSRSQVRRSSNQDEINIIHSRSSNSTSNSDDSHSHTACCAKRAKKILNRQLSPVPPSDSSVRSDSSDDSPRAGRLGPKITSNIQDFHNGIDYNFYKTGNEAGDKIKAVITNYAKYGNGMPLYPSETRFKRELIDHCVSFMAGIERIFEKYKKLNCP